MVDSLIALCHMKGRVELNNDEVLRVKLRACMFENPGRSVLTWI